jgi:hypothetical protein
MKKPSTPSPKNFGMKSFKKGLKAFYLIFSSLLISMLHVPFAFAKTHILSRNSQPPQGTVTTAPPPMPSPVPLSFMDSLQSGSFKSIYDSLQLNISGLSRQAFDYARKGWEKLASQGRILNESIIAIVDFSQPSSQKRLYVLDMQNYKVLFNTLVAHGRNSGKEWASSFSNRPSSYKSSPGFYITGETYFGDNGYSLKLNGIEHGINDNAMQRAIVIHGADYVNESYIQSQGYIGRSQGCPAVPRGEAREIIDAIKEGTCLFVYAPDGNYISHSSLL